MNKQELYYNSIDNEYKFGASESQDLQALLAKCRVSIPNYDEHLIRLAFNYCVLAHEGKLRKSGNKFYTHPLAVAFIVIDEIPLDNESVVAALLHNVLDESEIYTYEDIRFTFGTSIAQIVEGVARIKFVESQHIDRPDQIDNYRKLLLSLFSDIRIILIKLADKLDNMRTLEFVSRESQKKIARETLDIYAPFANRFGLRRIKFELEDLSFKYINPTAYEYIAATIKGTHREREEYVDRFKEPIEKLLDVEAVLKRENVTYSINGRAKSIYSTYNKTILRQKNVEELYDIFAIRIILDTDNPLLCFYTYGVVANYYKPIPETFKDYISTPKYNGYQSLHTAVAGPDDRVVEVQIRTSQMHHASEVGVAAHFRYKSGVKDSILEDTNIQSWLDEVHDVFDKIGNENSSKLIGIISNNMLHDKIYVFTPKDEFRQLPKGATALDFAFNIHTDIGLTCIGAKINGKLCDINQKLTSGDKVEIITSKKQTPSKEWLDFVVTSKASAKLIDYFKEQENHFIDEGKRIWETKNNDNVFKFTDKEMSFLLNSYNLATENEFYKAIGEKVIDVDKVYQLIMLRISETIRNKADNESDDYTNIKYKNQNLSSEDLAIKLDSSNFEFSTCCNPLPGDKIFGIETSESLISVHNITCSKYKKFLQTHPDDLMNLNWNQFKTKFFDAKLYVVAKDTDKIIESIVNKIVCENRNQITSVSYETKNSIFKGYFGFKIHYNIFIDDIIYALENLDGVQIVERISV